MQKKIKLRLVDIVFVLFCLAGAGYSFYKFYEELYRTLEKQNEQPIASIIIKENIAQRKFADGKVWDRLRTQANIYEGDTIHTTAKSLAAIKYIDENAIELGENTLIRVHLKSKDDESGSVINMENGTITVNTTNSSISIKSGDKIIVIGENSTLTAKQEEGVSDLVLYLKEGTASIQKLDINGEVSSGNGVELEAGYVTTINEAGSVIATVPQELMEELDLLYAEAPALIAPAVDYSASYRTKKPAVRFIWSSLNLANAYQLEIANNAQMNNPVFSQRVLETSRIINELEKGTWYWRVTPYYHLNKQGYGTPSEVRSFKIEQSANLSDPVLLMPPYNGIVSTKIPLENGNYVYKNVNLSWKENPEAVSYDVKLWNSTEDNPLVSTSTTRNFLEIDTSKLNVTNGRWYWKVVLTDSEGNKKESKAGQFVAIDDVVEQRTVYPPDGYRISEGRTADTRYSWKSNIPSDTIFEISNDPTFKKIIHKQSTTSNSLAGRTLSPDTYYWRIRADVSGLELKTQPKKLIVEAPMQAPGFIKPGNGQKAVVRPDRPYDIVWSAVEGADYYQIKVFPLGNPDKILFQKNYIEATSQRMNFLNWREQQYGVSLQAFRDETALYSRATSYLGNYDFRLVQIKPIELIYPEDNEMINGVDAVKNPGNFEYDYVGDSYTSEIIIYKDAVSPENEFLRIANPSKITKMPVFYAGHYYWTVVGSTPDKYDISVGKYRAFSVTPIEKMPKPEVLEPKNKRTFDKDYFRENRFIKFQWNQVPLADQYLLKLYSEDDQLLVRKVIKKEHTSYEFTELEKLGGNGTFTWTLEAQTVWGDVVFQNGIESVQTFKVSLPSIKTPKTTDEGVRYGR